MSNKGVDVKRSDMKKSLMVLFILSTIIIFYSCGPKHEYVDLGLPSGTKWATCNVGANTPEEYGDFYAWGETETKSEYTKENCVTCGESIDDISGNPNYDVARAKWGGSWRMPTKEEIIELIENCTWKWTVQNNVSGYKVTGSNGNSIFLPAIVDSSDVILRWLGSYWGSTPTEKYDNEAFSFGFHCNEWLRDINYDYCWRNEGLTVRPVSK